MCRYPTDVATYANDAQFMWGESLMIAPVINQVRCDTQGVLFSPVRWAVDKEFKQ